jgi:hypothetical protein
MRNATIILAALFIFTFTSCKKQIDTTAPSPAADVKANWSSSNPWGSWSNGGYTLTNDVWGSGAGPQTIWANSGTNWGITSTQPNGGGVRSYPNSYKVTNKTISNYNGTGSWNFSGPGGTNYWDASFDIWVPTEVMVWVYKTPGIGPIGSLRRSNVSISGNNWDVYFGGNNVLSFIRTSNSTSGSVNLGTMLKWGMNNGYYGNGNIGGNSFGFEVFGTGNVARNWTVNSMSIGN